MIVVPDPGPRGLTVLTGEPPVYSGLLRQEGVLIIYSNPDPTELVQSY